MTGMSLANPAGLWALSGLVAVLAIHFLQRRSRRAEVTTLFLLDALAPVSASGRRFERLRNSLLLWLQLLAIFLVTWLLVQPRWIRPDSRQTVAVVLDGSLSMDAFLPNLDAALADVLPTLGGAAAETQWIALESDPTRPRLYSGPSLADLRAALSGWQPRLGVHDPSAAFRLARSLAGESGSVIFVTDHPADLPDGIDWVGIGEPISNVGWIGLRVDGGRWTALVHNHGSDAARTVWHAERTDGGESPANELALEPGETRSISGDFPEGDDHLTLVLTGDTFPVDDRLPIVRPLAKELRMTWAADSRLAALFQRVSSSLPDARVASDSADLTFVEYDPLAPAEVEPGEIVFVADPMPVKNAIRGTIVSERHPLVADLNWQGLLARDSFGVPARDNDEVLLWQGGRPLVFLRGGENPALIVNFEVRQSNADRLPAFIVLLSRFAESARGRKVAFERANFELNQLLAIASDPTSPPPRIEGAPTAPVARAPARPGFFAAVADGSIPLLTGAAHFTDSREADFRAATSGNSLSQSAARLTERNSERDFLTAVWVLLLGAVIIASWAAAGRVRA